MKPSVPNVHGMRGTKKKQEHKPRQTQVSTEKCSICADYHLALHQGEPVGGRSV